MLAVDVQVSLSDRVRIERTIRSGLDRTFIIRAFHNATIDAEMRHMNVLWGKLAGEALRQASQSELAHREG